MEFLTNLVTNVPAGTPDATVEEIKAAEAKRVGQLAAEGHLLRLWKPPARDGEWRTLGLFSAADEGELRKILASLPLHIWMTVEITPLRPHHNDPVGRASSDG